MNAAINIGVGTIDPRKYDAELPSLKGAVNDCNVMTGISMRWAGVASGNAKRFPGPDATKDNVLGALSWAAGAVRDGLMILSFSGHGFPDTDSSEQGWCLYDGVLTELEIKQAAMQFTSGVRLLVVADCCYAMPEKGLMDALRRWWGRTSLASPVVKCVPKELMPAVSSSKAAVPKNTAAAVNQPPYHCGFMWFAACGSKQRAFDGSPSSLFTGALQGETSRGVRCNYETLCRRVASGVYRKQMPECRLISSGQPPTDWSVNKKAFT